MKQLLINKMRALLFLATVSLTFLTVHSLKAQSHAVDVDGKRLSVATCLEKSKEQEGFGNYRQASWFLNQAAMVRWEEKQYDEAIKYFNKSITLNERVNNDHGVIGIYSNLAMIYTDKEDHQTAYDYFEKTLQGRKKSGSDKVTIISSLINAGISLNNLSQHDKAAKYMEEALGLAREINDAQQMRSCYGMLSETYEKAGNTERSIYYFNLYRTFHEMVQRDKEEVYKEREKDAQMRAQLLEAEKKAQETELFYKQQEVERKKNELAEAQAALSQFDETKKKLYESMDKAEVLKKLYDVEKQEQIERQEKHDLQIQQQRYIQYTLLAGLLGIIAFASILFRNYKEKKRSNIALEEKNHEIMAQREHIEDQKKELEIVFTEVMHKNERITQSINYAERIQSAMMPSQEEMLSVFPKLVLFWRPRDIVSGDFYWAIEQNNYKIIVAADCTGHGVPGALVSMIGINLLNQIVIQEGVTLPHLILERLDIGIINALTHGSQVSRDGMDISIISIEKGSKKGYYAGAKNPLIYFEGQEEVVLKGDKKSVGGNLTAKQVERNFTLQEFPVKAGTKLYIYSDGYQDQFGGEEGRKFMSRNFRELLHKSSQLPIAQRHDYLETTLNDWKMGREQTDDILIVGIEL